MGLDEKAKSIQGVNNLTRTQRILSIDPKRGVEGFCCRKKALGRVHYGIIPFSRNQRGSRREKEKELQLRLLTYRLSLLRALSSLNKSLQLFEKSKKCPRREEVSDDVAAKFSADTCIYSDPGLMLKDVNQLLFREDETRLTKIGASRVVNWGLTGVFHRLYKAANEAVIQTKDRLMQQYMLGETDTWDAAKDIEISEQWKNLEELKDEVEDVEPKEQSDVTGQVNKDDIEVDPPKSPIV
ncbi:hypothetical protein LWI28_022617 [Acer negundo]|uniref:Uncharacterized protein n=1 Tax=Acer negundo TaxID=4023 RepID=A0AAD5NSR9_ACENE|nr:hypothetical protein LWI28_022617 [Acer negundo]